MYRNNNIYTLDLETGELPESNIKKDNLYNILEKHICVWGGKDDLLQRYMEGAQMIFVTLKNILFGGVTKGDIYRLLKKGNNIIINIGQIVNTNIRRIIFINEEQVFEDAKKYLILMVKYIIFL